jgi:Tfp pilus assembly protein PilF
MNYKLSAAYLRPMDRITRILAFLEQNPKDSFLRHALALEYIKLGQLNDAKTLFLAVLSDNPDYVGSYYHLAKLLETLEEREAAIEWYEKGMEAAKKAGDNHALNELRAAYEDLTF